MTPAPHQENPRIGAAERILAEAFNLCSYCAGRIKPGDKTIDGEHEYHATKWAPLSPAVTAR